VLRRFAFLYERHAHFRSFDILLRGRADSLLGAVQDAGDANDNVVLDGSEAAIPSADIYEVDADGRVLGRSANWAGADRQLQEKRSEVSTSKATHQTRIAVSFSKQ